MIKTLPIFIITLLLSAACSLPTAGVGSIGGTVYYAGTQTPLEGVAVIYGDSAIYTDIDGRYLYEGIPDGTQALAFAKDGYAKVYNYVNVPDKGKVICDAQLEIYKAGWAIGNRDSDYGVILYSTDGGSSWLRQGSPSSVPNVNLKDVCVIDPKTCWIVGDYDNDRQSFTILRTEDAGKTWTRQAKSISELSPCGLSSIISKDGTKAWAIADTVGYIVSTTNKGSAWKVAKKPEQVKYYTSITTPDGIHLWACGKSIEGGTLIEYSSDEGKTWTTYPVDIVYDSQIPTSIYATDTLNIFMTGSNAMGILKSSDGGKTWSATPFSDFSQMHSLYAIDANQLWVCGNENKIFRTFDGFNTNNRLNNPDGSTDGAAISISFLRNGSQGAAVLSSASGATGSIIHTTDGGDSWIQSSIPFNFALSSIGFVGDNN